MDGAFSGSTGERLRKVLFVLVTLLGVFLVVSSVSGLLSWKYIGTGVPATNTISVSGQGEVYAVPNIGTFTFSVVSLKPTVAAAQSEATQKINDLATYLKTAGIEDKDVKTVGYSISPQYEYHTQVCPVPSGNTAVYCPPGKQVLKGYEVRQSTEVKIRTTDKAGDLLSGVGAHGATDVSGLSFTVEDPTAVQAQARDKAIIDAKQKADVLAKQLGVSLVRVVSFSESNGGVIYPMDYGKGAVDQVVAASAPAVSVGQNKVTDTVTVTYEIK